jgi:nitrate reductase NapE component
MAPGVDRWRGFTILGVVRRLWIPLLVLVVIGAGGFTVSRLHGIFGSEKRPSYADTKINDTQPFNPKHLTYEVFGPPGTVANISYFDVNAEPQHIQGASLPWSLQFALTETSAVGASWRRAIVTALAAASSWTMRSKPRGFLTR